MPSIPPDTEPDGWAKPPKTLAAALARPDNEKKNAISLMFTLMKSVLSADTLSNIQT